MARTLKPTAVKSDQIKTNQEELAKHTKMLKSYDDAKKKMEAAIKDLEQDFETYSQKSMKEVQDLKDDLDATLASPTSAAKKLNQNIDINSGKSIQTVSFQTLQKQEDTECRDSITQYERQHSLYFDRIKLNHFVDDFTQNRQDSYFKIVTNNLKHLNIQLDQFEPFKKLLTYTPNTHSGLQHRQDHWDHQRALLNKCQTFISEHNKFIEQQGPTSTEYNQFVTKYNTFLGHAAPNVRINQFKESVKTFLALDDRPAEEYVAVDPQQAQSFFQKLVSNFAWFIGMPSEKSQAESITQPTENPSKSDSSSYSFSGMFSSLGNIFSSATTKHKEPNTVQNRDEETEEINADGPTDNSAVSAVQPQHQNANALTVAIKAGKVKVNEINAKEGVDKLHNMNQNYLDALLAATKFLFSQKAASHTLIATSCSHKLIAGDAQVTQEQCDQLATKAQTFVENMNYILDMATIFDTQINSILEQVSAIKIVSDPDSNTVQYVGPFGTIGTSLTDNTPEIMQQIMQHAATQYGLLEDSTQETITTGNSNLGLPAAETLQIGIDPSSANVLQMASAGDCPADTVCA